MEKNILLTPDQIPPSYVRCFQGDCPLADTCARFLAGQQEWILNLFRRNGYTEDLCFDGYREIYDFVSD